MSMPMSKRLKKDVKEQKEERWNGLPEDILQLIPQRLCLSDYQSFRQVCPNWRAAVNRGIATKSCFPPPQLPWLLLRKTYDHLHAFSIDNQFSCVRDPDVFLSIKFAYHPPYPPNLPTASLGSIGSWLIVAAFQRCENDISTTVITFFLNPLSHVRVMLPPQSTLEAALGGHPKSTFIFKKIVASSPPGLQDEDCVVAALTKAGNLGFCRFNDSAWTLIDTDFPSYRDIEIFDGKLYALTKVNTMLEVFDMSPNVTRAQRLVVQSPVPFRHLRVNSEWGCPCLAIDHASKELFVVLQRRYITKKLLQVYKTSYKIDGMRWEQATDLGDRTLFLSDQSNLFIHDKTFRKNCIYFAFSDVYDFGVYDLKDRTRKPLDFPPGYLPARSDGGHCQSLWFTPSPC